MKIVRKQSRVMGRMVVRTPTMDSRIPKDEIWIRRNPRTVRDAELGATIGSEQLRGAEGHDALSALILRNPRDACLGCSFFSQGRYAMGRCGRWKRLVRIDDTCAEFKVRMPLRMILVNPRFRRERLASPKAFDARSFRTEIPPGAKDHRVVVGCPTGKWDNVKKRCTVGTRAQALLHPKGEKNPCGVATSYKGNPDGARFEARDDDLYIDGKRVIKGWESFGGWYWFATEGPDVQDSVFPFPVQGGVFDAEANGYVVKGDRIWFGYVQGTYEEWGSWSEAELRSVRSRVWEIRKRDLPFAGRRNPTSANPFYVADARLTREEIASALGGRRFDIFYSRTGKTMVALDSFLRREQAERLHLRRIDTKTALILREREGFEFDFPTGLRGDK